MSIVEYTIFCRLVSKELRQFKREWEREKWFIISAMFVASMLSWYVCILIDGISSIRFEDIRASLPELPVITIKEI